MRSIKILPLLMIFAIAPAWAADKKGEPPEYLQKKHQMREAEMKSFDANKDGLLQVEELARGIDKRFVSRDLNKDGFLSSGEVQGHISKYKAQKSGTYSEKRVSKYSKRLEGRYKASDGNEDGMISKEEYRNYMVPRLKGRDKNKDGVLDKTEYRLEEEELPKPKKKRFEK